MTNRAYHIRLTQSGNEWVATLRELAPSHPELLPFIGEGTVGTAATAPAAIVAAVVAARIPEVPAPRRKNRDVA